MVPTQTVFIGTKIGKVELQQIRDVVIPWEGVGFERKEPEPVPGVPNPDV